MPKTSSIAASRRPHRKSPRYDDELPWKRVDVDLAAPTSNPHDEMNDEDKDSEGGVYNHYDSNSKLTSRAEADLEATPGEDVAMFVGLEVLKSEDYQVTSQGQLVAAASAKDSHQDSREEVMADDDFATGDETNYKDPTTRSRAKKRSRQEDTVVQPYTQKQDLSSGKESMNTSRRKKNRRHSHDGHDATRFSSEGFSGSPARSDTSIDATKISEEVASTANHGTNNHDDNIRQEEQVLALQTSWSMATGGVLLEKQLCHALLKQSFWTPTPIQAATLAPAILGRRNIVGAAATGSGKTLAYLLPICQKLLQQTNEQSANNGDDEKYLKALIITPTRELALQVSRECHRLLHPKLCGVVVGGLAHAKQRRILDKIRPPILVVTPGRLWELMSSREHQHLHDLRWLQFCVIDEADRMIQQGSFRELIRVFDAIRLANPMDGSDDEDNGTEDANEENGRLLGLPGIPGEAKVEMLDDVLRQIRDQPDDVNSNIPVPAEMDDDEFHMLQAELDEAAREEEVQILLPTAPLVQRQTFVFSATLTLPPSNTYVSSPKKSDKKRNPNKAETIDGAIAEILEKAQARGQTKVIDLTAGGKSSVAATTMSKKALESTRVPVAAASTLSRLPPGLSLYRIECTQRHKDSHLYTYLVTTAQGASGPCLVFCNSIAAVKRVSAMLQALHLPARPLHANMAQKARLKALESLREPKSRSIVVGTDVAARGLDIPAVATVVHYDVARKVDTFIHRSGRTARGVGEKATGSSLSLISPGEEKEHRKILEALAAKHLFQTVNMDGRLLASAQERTNLAAKVVACDHIESKAERSNRWFQDAAEEADLDLDQDLLEEGLAGGDRREQQQLREAQQARARLRQLLSQPMQTQKFGKFLSSNSAATKPEVTPFVVPSSSSKRERRRKRKGKK